jgi:single-strand DNA-binding protein
MASVNKAILIGNLGRNPEIRYTQAGQSVCNFSVATNERWTDKSGQPQERTEWHRVVVWGKQGEHCGQYLSKGRSVYVEGRIQTREWNDKEGRKNYTTEIIATQVTFLGGKGDGASHGVGGGEELGPPPPELDSAQVAGPATGKGGEEDIPF